MHKHRKSKVCLSSHFIISGRRENEPVAILRSKLYRKHYNHALREIPNENPIHERYKGKLLHKTYGNCQQKLFHLIKKGWQYIELTMRFSKRGST